MDPATIIALITAASTLISKLGPIMAERKRKGELTRDEERAWDEYVASQQSKPHWIPSK